MPPDVAPIVVLVRPQGPVNVGLACRAAANMGAQAIRLVSPGPLALQDERARPFACKAETIWSTLRTYESLPEAVQDCDFVLGTTRRTRHGRLPQWTAEQARQARAERGGLWAVVFGSEADGLSAEELAPCDAAMALDMPGAYGSLNLSHAVLLCLWELLAPPSTDAAFAASRPSVPEATSRERRALGDIVFSALQASGYFRRTKVERIGGKLERILRSARLSGADARLCAGVFRHFEFASRQRAANDTSAPS